jgi:hypothetical protein
VTNAHHEFDVFVSHASEDKSYARPLVSALERSGLAVWYDENALVPGMSLSSEIDYGLARSRFGIVILSRSFFSKNWPKHELAGLRARQINGQDVIIPIWLDIDVEFLLSVSPPLADMLAIQADRNNISEDSMKIGEIVNPKRNSRWLYNVVVQIFRGFDTAAFQGATFDYGKDGGLRSLYGRLVNFVTPFQLARYFGGKIWTSGPHSPEVLDLRNPFSFGHYNPDFIDWIHNNALSILARPAFIELTSGTFNNNFSELARLYYTTYMYLCRNRRILDVLTADLLPSQENGGVAKCLSVNLAWVGDDEDKSALSELMKRLSDEFDPNRSASALSFWVRRFADGSADKIASTISQIMLSYDSSVLSNMMTSTQWELNQPLTGFVTNYKRLEKMAEIALAVLERSTYGYKLGRFTVTFGIAQGNMGR